MPRLIDKKFLREPSLRKEVFERDHGVCAECGMDTEAFEEAVRRIPVAYESCRGYVRKIALEALDPPLNGRRPLWAADHIDPVEDGGGHRGLENIQTLCQVCHDKKTAEQKKRNSKAAKAEAKLSRTRELREERYEEAPDSKRPGP